MELDKGALDRWITGENDPNNPANQVDFSEQYSAVYKHCDWITEDMWDDDKVCNRIEELTEKVAEKFFISNKYYSKKQYSEVIKDNALAISIRLKELYYAKT